MASSESNENNSQLSSSIDKSMSRKSFYEHEESLKNNQMASKKLSNSSDGKPEQIEDMDEKELKHLLDEAITFRNPRDANEKSDTFKRLLQTVTDEDECARKFESSGLNSFWKAQSNSLQNLIDDSNFNLLPIHQSHTSSKKHQQRRKNSTSVSTRRVEGGSLPVDMHHSSAIQSPPDQPFLFELKNSKKRQKEKQQQAKDTVIDMADNETEDRKYQRLDKDKENSSYHDAIEMKTFSNRSAVEHHLMDDQNVSKYTNASIAPTITTMASMMSSPISTSMINTKVSSSAGTTSVDSTIPYTLLCNDNSYQKKYNEIQKPQSYQQAQVADTMIYHGSTVNHSNNIVLAGGSGPNYGTISSGGKIDQALPLPAGAGISSVMDSKYNPSKRQQSREDMSHHTSVMQPTPQMSLNNSNPQASSNLGGSNSSKDPKAKKRTAKSERNEKTIDVQSIEGFCGNEPVEALLSYIDGDKGNSGNQKNHPKNGLLTAQLLNSDEKKKKMVAKNKEKVNKLKKSNSMDELCSTGRQQQQQQQQNELKVTANKIAQDSTAVTLRSKSSITKKSLGGEGKEGVKENKIQQSKRNERRSWGTEGLSWPDSNAILTTSNNDEEQHETSSSSSCSGVQLDIQENSNISANNNNTISSNSTNVNSNNNNNTTNSTETSISAEAEKFQLVSKKRKVKRKSSEAPEFKTSSLSSTTTAVVNNNNLYTMTRGGRGGGDFRNNSSSSGTKTTYNDVSNRNESRKKPMMSHDAKQTVTHNNTATHVATATAQSSKSRRKSTSSMPHSEEGEECEYSDGGDSVQSLPIETTKTTSSLLSAPQTSNTNSNNPPLPTPNNNHNSTLTSAENKSSKKNPIVHQQFQLAPQQQVVQQTLQKPTTFSYADIAKTSTSNRQNNLGTNVIAAASTEKWPSISSSSSHQSTTTTTNNSTDPFAPTSHDGKQQQPKVTTASSTMSFPDLVESNNNRNKQISSSSSIDAQLTPAAPPTSTVSVSTTTALNGNDALQTELNGMVFMFDGGIETDRINNNKISYSQSLLENHQNHELDANGNAQLKKDADGAIVNTSKNVLIKSRSVDHNNLSSIEHYPALEKTKQTLSEVLSKPIEGLMVKGKQKQQFSKSIATATTIVAPVTILDDKAKKKAQKKNVSTSTSPPSSHQLQVFSSSQQNHNNHDQRPAVIIMNDSASYENTTTELGITFGFDINEHLLESSNNNNNNCDIMNTNLSCNNLSNNQSCGIELYENYMGTTTLHGDHHSTIIHASSPESSNCNINEVSNDLGYISSSILTQSPPANLIINNQQSPPTHQLTFSDNGQPNERDFALQVTPMEIQASIFVPASLPRFISPLDITTKNFNYEELVMFVSEEWTKAMRNGIFFNGQ